MTGTATTTTNSTGWAAPRPVAIRFHGAHWRRGSVRLSVVWALLSGCIESDTLEPSDLQSSFAELLGTPRGCGDVLIEQSTQDDRVALRFVAVGLIKSTYDSDQAEGAFAFDLSVPGGWLMELREGSSLSSETCIVPPADEARTARVDRTWRATAGIADVTVQVTEGSGEQASTTSAHLLVRDLQLEYGDQSMSVPTWEVIATVGEFPTAAVDD